MLNSEKKNRYEMRERIFKENKQFMRRFKIDRSQGMFR